MPTYQYACTDCGEPLEVVQRFSDEPMTECPVCGGQLRKVFSAAAVVFKGSGFYHNDSRAPAKSESKPDDKKDKKDKKETKSSSSSEKVA